MLMCQNTTHIHTHTDDRDQLLVVSTFTLYAHISYTTGDSIVQSLYNIW